MPGPSTCPHTINHRMSKKLLSGHTFLGLLKRTGHRQLGFDKIGKVLGFPTYPAHLSWPRPWKLSRMLFPHHTTLVLVSFSLSISLRLSHECPGPPVLTPNTPRPHARENCPRGPESRRGGRKATKTGPSWGRHVHIHLHFLTPSQSLLQVKRSLEGVGLDRI